MRSFLTVLIIVALLLYFGYRFVKKSVENLTFSQPKFSGIDLLNFINKTGFSTVDLSTTITNKNNFDIPVNNLYLEISHEGNLVGKSTIPHEKFVIPNNGAITESQNVTLSLASSFSLAAKLLAKQPIVFDYTIKGTLFNFFPLNYSDKFTY